MTYLLPKYVLGSTGPQTELESLCGAVFHQLKVTDESVVEVSPSFVMYIDGTSTLTISALSNESAGNYTLSLEASLSTNSDVNDTMYLFDLVVHPVEEQVISNSTTNPI